MTDDRLLPRAGRRGFNHDGDSAVTTYLGNSRRLKVGRGYTRWMGQSLTPLALNLAAEYLIASEVLFLPRELGQAGSSLLSRGKRTFAVVRVAGKTVNVKVQFAILSIRESHRRVPHPKIPFLRF